MAEPTTPVDSSAPEAGRTTEATPSVSPKAKGREAYEAELQERLSKKKFADAREVIGGENAKIKVEEKGASDREGDYGKASTKVKVAGDLKEDVRATKDQAEINKTLRDSGQELDKGRQKETTRAGNIAHNTIDETHAALLDRKKAAEKALEDAQKKLNSQLKDKKIDTKEYNKQLTGVHKAHAEEMKSIAEGEKKLGELRAKVTANTGVQSKFNPEKPSAKPLTNRAVIDEAKGVIGAEKFNQLGGFQKKVASVKANLKTGGFTTARTAVGLVAAPAFALAAADDLAQGMGMKQPGTDEQGKPLPTDGKIFTGLAKGGAAIASLALALKGGANRAMGH